MPSTSDRQQRFMNAVAHNEKFAKKVGVPQLVGREFSAADKVASQQGPGVGGFSKLSVSRRFM